MSRAALNWVVKRTRPVFCGSSSASTPRIMSWVDSETFSAA
ncbi:MAG: hypothetical protein U1F87_15495 [Kiritimatiellia bacterium]